MWLGKLTTLDMTHLVYWAVKPKHKRNADVNVNVNLNINLNICIHLTPNVTPGQPGATLAQLKV